jgi:hypothetical protein
MTSQFRYPLFDVQVPANNLPPSADSSLGSAPAWPLAASSCGAASLGAAASAAPLDAADPFSVPPSYDPLAEELAAVARPAAPEQAAASGWQDRVSASSTSSDGSAGRAEASPGTVALCLLRQALKALASLQQAGGGAPLNAALRAELASIAAELQQAAGLLPPPTAPPLSASGQENAGAALSTASPCSNGRVQQGSASKADLAAMKAQILTELRSTLHGELLRELRRQP